MEELNGFDNVLSSENESFEESSFGQHSSSHKLKKRKYEDIPGSDSHQKKKNKNDLYRPPTVEELNNLKETENLYNNNLFRLQIEELLSEVIIKNKRTKSLANWLDQFDKIVENLPECEILLSSIKQHGKTKSKREKIKSRENKIRQKLLDYEQIFKTDQDLTLKFVKPESYQKFGLYENKCLPGPNLMLNLNLIMPKCCFNTKDFLNNRYLTKRYYYLVYISEQLKTSGLTSKLTILSHEDNILLPVLAVEPNNVDKMLVIIYATPSPDTFKPARFAPEQNNVKCDLFDVKISDDIIKSSPTIFYNTALGYDITLFLNNEFIKETLYEQSNLQDGIKLLYIWSKQRELDIGASSLNQNLIVYFIVYLFIKKKINKYMSSYQVIRIFWTFLATTNLHKEPISLTDTSKDIFDSFIKYFDIVCLDRSSYYNVTAFLNLETYKKIKMECQTALKLLDGNKSNSFQQLFLIKHPFYLQYDLIIDLTPSIPLIEKLDLSEYDMLMFLGYKELAACDNVSAMIKRGLNKRILNFVPHLEFEDNNLKRLLFGINLNPDEAFNFLEMGPSLNDFKAADEFRNFWGHLSSDRRFRDGSTNVAVHFKTNTMKGKRSIIRKILGYILGEKLNLKYKLHYDEFDEVLFNKYVVPSYPSGTNEETILKIIHASDELGKKLRDLQMSLKITGIQGISETFSFTEVFPPMPTNYNEGHSVTTVLRNNLIFSDKIIESIPRLAIPIECVLQLEHSSKWPNELEALRHIKTAFYLEISKMLHKGHKIMSHVTTDFIEVFYEGIVFRYKLYVPKEIGLLKKVDMENGLTCFRDSEQSSELEKSLVIMPRVLGALKGIQSIYPSYGPGTCIIKRWLRSQLIDGFYLSDIVIDLLNASLYLCNSSLCSTTPQISFLRFLKFLADFDWELQTVLVNFNDDLTNEEITTVEGKLQENRMAYPLLYIIMPYDKGLSIFTKYSPSKEVLLRLRDLAKESLNFVNNKIYHQNVFIKELFVPNFDGYNVLIQLKPSLNPRRHEQVIPSNIKDRVVLEKYDKSKKSQFPIVNFNPIEIYLKELRENYGKYAMFFHDSYGGNTIGVLWNPKVYESMDFKVSRINACKLVDGKIIFNMDAVIEDFYILGSGIVETIEKR